MIHTTDQSANSLLGIRPYLEHFPELRSGLLLSVGHTREVERLNSGRGKNDSSHPVSPELLSEIDSLWNSLSWKTLRPFRNMHHRLKGLSKESKPTPRSDLEAARLIVSLRNSLCWELTSPLRLFHRIFSRRQPALNGSLRK
jgi:hypothetical protein